MRSIAIGLVVGLVVAPVSNNGGLGLAVGLVAFLFSSQLDRLEQRLRAVEARSEADAAPLPAAVPEREPAPATPVVPTRPVIEPPATAAQTGPAGWEPPHEWQPPRRWQLPAFEDLERLVAGRGLAIVGGLALLLGGIFFLGLAFSRGWIGPEARVVIGLAAGIGLFGLGAWVFGRGQPIVAHVLVAVGLGVLSLSLFAATRLYGFIGPELGVAAALGAAGAAAVLAIRTDSQLIAGFGLVAVLASPPVMGASATLVTMIFLGTALAGTTAISLYRTWRWLPAVAFLLAAPQLGSYVSGTPALVVGLLAVAAFWLLNVLAAGGEEFRVRRQRLSATSATLLVITTVFTVWAGFEVLQGDLERWRGLFTIGLAVAQLGIGAYFLRRDGERHPFGMLTAATGIAALTLAVPIQLGAPWVPLAWSAEAVALAWLYVQWRHGYSGLAATVLGTLAVSHILVVEYPLGAWTAPAADAVPFANPDGLALAFVLAAMGVAIWLLRERWQRVTIAGVGAGLLIAAAPFELDGLAHAGLLAAMTVAAALTERRLLRIPVVPARVPEDDLSFVGDRALYAASALAAATLAWLTLDRYLPVDDVISGLAVDGSFAALQFANDATAITGMILIAGIGLALAGGRAWRQGGVLVAAAAIAWLMPTQLGAAWSVVSWAGLVIALVALRSGEDPPLRAGSWLLGAAAVIETLAVVASPERLVVRGSPFAEPMLVNGGTLAVAALAVMFAAARPLSPRDAEARWAGAAAGAAAVYLASIGLVDVFQAQLGGPIRLEELQKQAHVALSVLWALVGATAFVIGLASSRTAVRLSGLGLLGIVTVKVFIVDLAALDVAYRVLSFVALGILLLGAAYLYGRLQPRDAASP